MVKALILDYNGVIVNDEPLHLQAFRVVLEAEGIPLDSGEYYTRYLGVSDRDIARDALSRRGAGAGDLEDQADHLLARKALAYRQLVRRHLPEVAGAPAFILEAARRFPLAVASGSLRVEVEDGLYRLGVRDAITAIVTIEDVTRGKPDPETFIRAREALLRTCSMADAPSPLEPDEPTGSFLVIEDSPAGLAAARAAWMPAIAVATSRPASDLKPAELVLDDLTTLTPEMIDRL